MANMLISSTTPKTITSQAPNRPAFAILKYSGNFGATEGSETTVDIVPVDAYRSVLFSLDGSAWNNATVAVKIYPCDSQGNTIGANPFFSFSVTSNSTVVTILAEMGGSTTVTPYPPNAAASSGSFIGPFGNFLKVTEQCTAFVAGTNTVTLELDMKG